jgi:hypothetical protein
MTCATLVPTNRRAGGLPVHAAAAFRLTAAGCSSSRRSCACTVTMAGHPRRCPASAISVKTQKSSRLRRGWAHGPRPGTAPQKQAQTGASREPKDVRRALGSRAPRWRRRAVIRPSFYDAECRLLRPARHPVRRRPLLLRPLIEQSRGSVQSAVVVGPFPCEEHLCGDLVLSAEGDADAGDAPYRPCESVVGEQLWR